MAGKFTKRSVIRRTYIDQHGADLAVWGPDGKMVVVSGGIVVIDVFGEEVIDGVVELDIQNIDVSLQGGDFGNRPAV